MTAPILIKTPCASAVLDYFGVTGTTWNERTRKNVWEGALRRAGFSVRSRFSALGKTTTVGGARNKIAAIAQADNTIRAFVVRVEGHVIVVDRNGNTVVDTDCRTRDRRRVKGIVAVF